MFVELDSVFAPVQFKFYRYGLPVPVLVSMAESHKGEILWSRAVTQALTTSAVLVQTKILVDQIVADIEI